MPDGGARNEVSRFVADVVAQARGPVALDRQTAGVRASAAGFGQQTALTRNADGSTIRFLTLDFDALDDSAVELD